MHPGVNAAPHEGAACTGLPGTVYLLCFGEPGLHVTGNRYARHYLGWTQGEVGDALLIYLAEHAPLVRAAADAGLTVNLARTWPDVDRDFLAVVRRRNEAPRLCPACCQAADREPLNPVAA